MPGELIELLPILHLIRHRRYNLFAKRRPTDAKKFQGNAFIRHSFIHRHLDHTGRGARLGRRIAPAVDRRHFPPARRADELQKFQVIRFFTLFRQDHGILKIVRSPFRHDDSGFSDGLIFGKGYIHRVG